MPKLKINPIKATSVSTAVPLLYDSGVLYDDSDAYYDLMYPYDADMTQGEIPKAILFIERKKVSVKKESVAASVRKENVIIKSTETF